MKYFSVWLWYALALGNLVLFFTVMFGAYQPSPWAVAIAVYSVSFIVCLLYVDKAWERLKDNENPKKDFLNEMNKFYKNDET